jgi:hypothetical protein
MSLLSLTVVAQPSPSPTPAAPTSVVRDYSSSVLSDPDDDPVDPADDPVDPADDPVDPEDDPTDPDDVQPVRRLRHRGR